ncbi:MAG: propanediol utilization protein [Paracoccaceae bacterium]
MPATQARVARVCGHLGELVQGRFGAGGPLALVTLPCDGVEVHARFGPNTSPLAAIMAARLGHDNAQISVEANVPPGCGAGVSTATLLATLRLLAPGLSAEAESAHLLAVEGAVDPLAFAPAPPRIWASRRAQTLELLPVFPRMVVVGGFDGPGQLTNPADENFPDMSAAFALLRLPTPARIGQAASISALANQQRNPRPNWGAAQELAAETGALGIAVAHTGAALSLLFAPGAAGIGRAQAGLDALGLSHVMRFEFGQGAQL